MNAHLLSTLQTLASNVENVTDDLTPWNYSTVSNNQLQFMNSVPPNVFTETVYNFSTDDPSLNLTKVVGAKTQLLMYDYLIPTIGALIIILNAIVVISSGLILRSGANPRTTYLFLGNVAMADLVTGVAVIFGQLYPKESRDQTTCAIQLGMIVASTLVSVWSVGLIAIDRFLYILQGMKYQRLIYPRRARVLILGTWIIGLIIGFLPAMGWTGINDNGRVCWFIRLAPPGLVLLTTCVGLLPIILVLVLYSVILYHAILKVKQLRKADLELGRENASHANQNKQNNPQHLRIFRGGNSLNANGQPLQKKSSPKKAKAIKVVVFTSGSFVLTWLPYFTACSIYVFSTEEEVRKPLRLAIASPLAILGFFNSLLNPVIYAWWHNGFRNFMYKLICRKRPQNQASVTKSSSKQNSKSYRKRRNFSSTSTTTSTRTTDTSENTKL